MSGKLDDEVMDAMLDSLPIEMSFVEERDVMELNEGLLIELSNKFGNRDFKCSLK